MEPDVRLCFVGDSFVNGTGDRQYLGWTGRLCAATAQRGYDLTHYNLGVRRETSLQIEQRWQSEVAARLADSRDCRVIFSFGVNDTTHEVLGTEEQRRVPWEATRDCTERLLWQAKDTYPVLMVGPPPIADEAQNQRIEDLSDMLAAVCRTLDVPYLDIYRKLSQSPLWRQEVTAGDGAHPNAAGYAILADLVFQWSAWQGWFPAAVS